MSFNSLPTGKSFRTAYQDKPANAVFVPIPFQRESPFGQYQLEGREGYGEAVFQFPSNGKVLSDGS